jgi:hypothetical protein
MSMLPKSSGLKCVVHYLARLPMQFVEAQGEGIKKEPRSDLFISLPRVRARMTEGSEFESECLIG